jgi:hypothetical protein
MQARRLRYVCYCPSVGASFLSVTALRGLVFQIIDSKSILPVAVYNRLQFQDTSLTGRWLKAWLTLGMVSIKFTLWRAKILCSLKAEL